MNKAYLLLGSNEGDKLHWLQQGQNLVEKHCGHTLVQSSIYETAAWGLEDQPDFYNKVICIETRLSPTELLKGVQNIETELGRQRKVKWGQRTLDIDILLYNNETINLPELVIPHPFLAERRFTLAPLNEVASHLVHPTIHKTIAQLLADCPDKLPVHIAAIETQ